MLGPSSVNTARDVDTGTHETFQGAVIVNSKTYKGELPVQGSHSYSSLASCRQYSNATVDRGWHRSFTSLKATMPDILLRHLCNICER